MTPEMSRALAQIKTILNLQEDGPQMADLLEAARTARSVDELPNWAQAALNYARTLE